MKTIFFIFSIFVTLTLVSCNSSSYNKKNQTTITIGSGSKNAMYYPVATALCEIFNKYNQDQNVVCKAKLSKGAEYNLDAVEDGEFSMGISQANLQYDAYKGYKQFDGDPHKNLRTLFEVHYEYLTIIAKKDSSINSFSDLKGKKVNIGNSGSGSRVLFTQMIKKLRWDLSYFKEIYEESGSNINKVLCNSNKADAAVYIVGHPNKSFATMLDKCNAKLVNLSDSEIKLFTSLAPKDFFKASIPENTYLNNQAINTFASKTILSTSAKIDPKIVQNFVKIIRGHREELIKKQLSLTTIKFSNSDELKLAPFYQGLGNSGK